MVYSGTKHAVSAMAESLRREIGKDGIRVTCVEPGAVKTEFVSQMRADVRAAVAHRLGDMEQLESDDVADSTSCGNRNRADSPERAAANPCTVTTCGVPRP